MFIHWGLYAIPARGEWVQYQEGIPGPVYERFAPQFNPVKFDARQWVALAKQAGMKYLVITTKHHDGFCMFDTKLTDYNIVKATPFGRDPGEGIARPNALVRASASASTTRSRTGTTRNIRRSTPSAPRSTPTASGLPQPERQLPAVPRLHAGAASRTAHQLRPGRHHLLRLVGRGRLSGSRRTAPRPARSWR